MLDVFEYPMHIYILFKDHLTYSAFSVEIQTNLPIFKLKESCVRRRYSDFEWLKNELERDSKVWLYKILVLGEMVVFTCSVQKMFYMMIKAFKRNLM